MSSSSPGAAPNRRVRIAVDCMGGDHGPAVTLPACRAFLAAHPQAEVILVGRPEALAPARHWERCTTIAAAEVVEMDDAIEVALRRKKDSSLRIALNQVKPDADGAAAAQACVSAGNTGALMAVARYVLKTLEGIDRPAIATVLPNEHDGGTTVLDLGANVDCTAEHLLQFAVMGSALVTAIYGKADPSIGLLNVGEEMIKGSESIKRAGELLRSVAEGEHLNYHGNVEGDDVFKGTVDIIVCDGFSGNVMLKTSEGAAKMIGSMIRQEFDRNWWTRLVGALAKAAALGRFGKRLDPRGYNGAALLGLKGLVFKSHGGADVYSFGQALNRAHDAARNRLLDGVHDRIVEAMQALPPTGGEAIAQAA